MIVDIIVNPRRVIEQISGESGNVRGYGLGDCRCSIGRAEWLFAESRASEFLGGNELVVKYSTVAQVGGQIILGLANGGQ